MRVRCRALAGGGFVGLLVRLDNRRRFARTVRPTGQGTASVMGSPFFAGQPQRRGGQAPLTARPRIASRPREIGEIMDSGAFHDPDATRTVKTRYSLPQCVRGAV